MLGSAARLTPALCQEGCPVWTRHVRTARLCSLPGARLGWPELRCPRERTASQPALKLVLGLNCLSPLRELCSHVLLAVLQRGHPTKHGTAGMA